MHDQCISHRRLSLDGANRPKLFLMKDSWPPSIAAALPWRFGLCETLSRGARVSLVDIDRKLLSTGFTTVSSPLLLRLPKAWLLFFLLDDTL